MDYMSISSLREAAREWTIRVKILRKGTVDKYNGIKGSGMYQKYLLQDNKGVLIQATIFNENINKLQHQLNRGMTYLLSNGFVRSINKAYANAHDSLEIMLGPTTSVQPADTPVQDGPYSYTFIQFDNLQGHMGPSSTIDVIGYVIRVDPLISIKASNTDDQLFKRDVILSNLRSQNIMFTLWADLAAEEGEILATLAPTKPIIAISKAKVVDKNGAISISSLVITTIEIDPQILDHEDMKEWRDLHHQVSTSEYGGIQLNTSYEELKLDDLITRDFTTFKHSYYCFRGEIIAVTNENAPLYNACNKCNKKVEKDSTECTNCSNKETIVTQRYMLKLNVQDDTRKAAITIFDVADKIFGCPPTELSTQMDLDFNDNVGWKKSLTGRRFIFTVKIQKSNDTFRKAGRFVAHDVQDVSDTN